jgi:hypothetical protein
MKTLEELRLEVEQRGLAIYPRLDSQIMIAKDVQGRVYAEFEQTIYRDSCARTVSALIVYIDSWYFTQLAYMPVWEVFSPENQDAIKAMQAEWYTK